MAPKTEQELALERTYELARKKKARALASHLAQPTGPRPKDHSTASRIYSFRGPKA